MNEITIFRHEDGTARGIVWAKRGEPTLEEINPEGAVLLTYTLMPHDFCEYVKNETKERVHALLNTYIV